MEFKENNYERIVELFNQYGNDEKWYDVFYTNDYPIPYKDLVLFPVQLDLYKFFFDLVECLVLPHLTSGDIDAISKSYFEYLIYLAEKKQSPQYLAKLIQLLSIVLRMDVETFSGKRDIDIVCVDSKYFLKINNSLFDSNDFDKIRKIICEQNGIELPDEETNPEILEAAREAEAQRRKLSKIKMCDLEDQINIIVATTSYTREECLKLTIRSFSRLFERIDKIMHYKIYTLLSPDLKPEARDKIEYYAEAHKTNKEKLLSMQQDAATVEKNFSKGKGV